ncbi:1,4-alpha-glucan branching protein GlgB [Desulfofalx alkaliphila]|uniref:1,4-alpha-glucan branching protein GlgB n=1 Tax=Desulfofalx alkaliphila TaxID=105483 RepID=UPI000A9EE66F|nr:1,4-alpha-glucan branching protein GlgB [Desulfofalx alkaliphila]
MFSYNDLYLFHKGLHYQIYRKMGAHIRLKKQKSGVQFAVWAPKAAEVRVVGDFNNWNGDHHLMKKRKDSGIWTLFVPELKEGDIYKYQIITDQGETILKSDPYGFYAQCRPQTASKVFNLGSYHWGDSKWQKKKKIKLRQRYPLNIYEVHLGSWKRGHNNSFLTYRHLANELVDYVVKMGYTHIELLPLSEHPYDGSWGYQSTGYFSVTSRYGNPRDFMYFIDKCHQRGVGVILDWVPGHFCKDDHGLRMFDGSPLYEHENPLKRENHQWGTCNFDFTKPEVLSFLISNAYFWFEVFHIDGLRIDAVAQMLYLDYGKEEGQWVANKYGGKENLEAVGFMKKLNEIIFKNYPNALMIAEDSSQWPMVTKPTYMGGLGYNYKWNMGWMNDMLRYMETDCIHRKWHHNLLTFSFTYAFSEDFVLPLSHDEVVHGKKSLLNKMPGDYWQKFANLRLLLGYMMAHPGKKLLFMGGEFGQFIEWQYQQSLDWHLLDYDMHQKLQNYVKQLNHFYRKQRALWENDKGWHGFQWIDHQDYSQSVIVFIRRAINLADYLLIVCNFTPVVRKKYRIGVPELKVYEEIFNSDWEQYGGSGQKNNFIKAQSVPWHNQPYSAELNLPPLAVVILQVKN